ncbi:elongation factor P [candidate division WOR-1 bacterium RIFOXYA12_FULL_52_29]|uniref:Elongation factor P n=1 Tax=candidate division WOR-1 bacterium RIFOXYC12_FULL_54_18 TaxID=1802584 RepID=A0A1F4T607_UNCSA|nr:MAG: elongation factor P [candidate division WOR-1 bacterium RIFOXYA2_FULL_51_19]OGC17785.1 MAG: elongation factor P [candidate division WOR-1 bacterium RIFOXYA12_FULL_52_29]OGC26642.1 MAG: elongation factor P [candidate division WOR-1 bacterium RIFOXYB2_FULL_45_9]OGC28202.1 MAG: elongation factor P [candidate division WOR-1 bacterium RIFOXYC12_FULL_54_18]OGC29510.1 MAG: elongation factor P [candidate division WOR-1 bacterium RIFOXYB12_FULL_52_16]
MAISITEVRPGTTVEIDGKIYKCLEYNHIKWAQQARVKTKFKDLRSGAIIERTFNVDDKVERARIEYQPMQFLYSDTEGFHFMNQATFEQITVPEGKIGDQSKYLKEGFVCNVSFYGEEVLDIDLPATVELKVVETSPGFKGDTVSGGKPATLETGAVVQVPFFINVGEVLKVDTSEGKYLGRV